MTLQALPRRVASPPSSIPAPLDGRLAEPPVEKARFAILLITLTPAPERPLANPQQFRCFQLTKLSRLVTTQ